MGAPVPGSEREDADRGGRVPERLVVGRIVRPHGVRGEVLVESLSDAPQRFRAGALLGAERPDGRVATLTVESSRGSGGRLLVRFREIADRDGAEAARGTLLSIPSSEAMTPPEGSYFPHQIEGLEVADESGRRIGRIARVVSAPAHDVWVVDVGGGEVMLPAVAEVIRSVDLQSGRITIRPQPGMLE
ncbi:MAG: ribosome maturation factor RimM [Acidobacteria bacterium]|nr:ribosome maturation factor RimM [Acidobacteriota bacterium]